MTVKICVLGLVLAVSIAGCNGKAKSDKSPAPPDTPAKTDNAVPVSTTGTVTNPGTGAAPVQTGGMSPASGGGDSSGKDSFKDPMATKTGKTKPSAKAVQGLALSGVQPMLEGTWLGACQPEAESNAGATSFKIEFLGSTETDYNTIFDNPSTCSAASRYYETRDVYKFQLKGNNFDKNIRQQFATPFSDAGKSDLQQQCSTVTFEVGKETDVSNCSAFAPPAKTIFDVVDIQGGKLYSGDTTAPTDGTIEAKRPTQLDGSTPLNPEGPKDVPIQ